MESSFVFFWFDFFFTLFCCQNWNFQLRLLASFRKRGWFFLRKSSICIISLMSKLVLEEVGYDGHCDGLIDLSTYSRFVHKRVCKMVKKIMWFEGSNGLLVSEKEKKNIHKTYTSLVVKKYFGWKTFTFGLWVFCVCFV